MTRTRPERPSLASFWHDLPREGKLLLSVVVFEFIGTGLVLPFWVVSPQANGLRIVPDEPGPVTPLPVPPPVTRTP